MNPLVSVIVPVYNGKRTIARCLDSVVNQSYKNIEIVVVNDGSNDGTDQALRDYFANTIIKNKVITIPNGGLANARNVGWKAASGDYCVNLDADDYLELDIFESIFNIKTDDFDVCYYGFRGFDLNGNVVSWYEDRFKYIDNLTGIDAAEMKLSRKMWICQGSALYKKELIFRSGITNIPGLNQGEDLLFITSALAVSKKVVCINKTGVNIEKSTTSMMHSSYNDSFLQSIYAAQKLHLYLNQFDAPRLCDYSQIEIFNQICRVCKVVVNTDNISFYKKITMIRKIKSGEFDGLSRFKSLVNKTKLLEFYIIRHSSLLYFLISKIYTKINR